MGATYCFKHIPHNHTIIVSLTSVGAAILQLYKTAKRAFSLTHSEIYISLPAAEMLYVPHTTLWLLEHDINPKAELIL